MLAGNRVEFNIKLFDLCFSRRQRLQDVGGGYLDDTRKPWHKMFFVSTLTDFGSLEYGRLSWLTDDSRPDRSIAFPILE